MSFFQNILVGVDLLHSPNLAKGNLGLIAEKVIKRSEWIANLAKAKLLFFCAMRIGDEVLQQLPEDEKSQITTAAKGTASGVLQHITEEARKKGIDADYKLVQGRGSIEMTRQVEQGGHDLVIVGTRNMTGVRRLLFGNTAMRLFHVCPCPVWVTRPGTRFGPLRILIATDLKPGSEYYLQKGIELAALTDSEVHVLHAVDYPLDHLWSSGLLDHITENYHQTVREKVEETLDNQLAQTEAKSLGDKLHIHLADDLGLPDLAIQHYLQRHQIDLLVMGTMARSGMPAFFMGNSAERVLSQVQCSVLVFKPPGFESPVQGE